MRFWSGRSRLVVLPGAVSALVLVACAPSKPSPPPAVAPFLCTGAAQTFAVPAGVTQLVVDAYGAQGGTGDSEAAGNRGPGGRGGHAVAAISVTPGQSLEVYVGCQGADGDSANFSVGGFNGGGNGEGSGVPERTAGAGGGASDVRAGGSKLVVAGGGGGGGVGTSSQPAGAGGAGGGVTGVIGGNGSGNAPNCTGGGPGTATVGGAGGSACAAGTDPGNPGELGVGGTGQVGVLSGGGGGGGFYGGGGAGENTNQITSSAGGGGGSGFGPPGTAYETGVWAGDGLVVIYYTQ